MRCSQRNFSFCLSPLRIKEKVKKVGECRKMCKRRHSCKFWTYIKVKGEKKCQIYGKQAACNAYVIRPECDDNVIVSGKKHCNEHEMYVDYVSSVVQILHILTFSSLCKNKPSKAVSNPSMITFKESPFLIYLLLFQLSFKDCMLNFGVLTNSLFLPI